MTALLLLALLAVPLPDNLSQDIPGRGNVCTSPIWYTQPTEGLRHLDPLIACIIGGDPNRPKTTQGGSAHTLEVWGLDGVLYSIADQGFGKLYAMPADSAGPAAIKVWQDCMDAIHNPLPCNGWEGTGGIPGGRQTAVLKLLSAFPASQERDYNLTYYSCANAPSPVPPSPLASAVARTPTKTTPPPCCDGKVYPCPLNVTKCPMTPTRVWTQVTPRTTTRTATAAQATTTPSPMQSHTVTAKATSTHTPIPPVPSPTASPSIPPPTSSGGWPWWVFLLAGLAVGFPVYWFAIRKAPPAA